MKAHSLYYTQSAADLVARILSRKGYRTVVTPVVYYHPVPKYRGPDKLIAVLAEIDGVEQYVYVKRDSRGRLVPAPGPEMLCRVDAFPDRRKDSAEA